MHKIKNLDKVESNQFVKVDFALLDDLAFLKRYKSKYLLTLLLRRYIVRKPYNGDLDLYKNYWKKGMLASSKSIRWLAQRFGMKKTNTIERWIAELKKDGVFKTEEIDVGKPKPQTVYVFGRHNSGEGNDYREEYFVNDVYFVRSTPLFASKSEDCNCSKSEANQSSINEANQSQKLRTYNREVIEK